MLPARAEGEDLVDQWESESLRILNAEFLLFEKRGGRPAAERQIVDDHAELAMTFVTTVHVERLSDVAGVVGAELHVDAAAMALPVFLLDLGREESKRVRVAADVGEYLKAQSVCNGFCFFKIHNSLKCC